MPKTHFSETLQSGRVFKGTGEGGGLGRSGPHWRAGLAPGQLCNELPVTCGLGFLFWVVGITLSSQRDDLEAN